jgi:benzoyl-CoA reductase/2-hydroxyglutaryl-CoA dehydratase subunit BcrC/BadD/HgdB
MRDGFNYVQKEVGVKVSDKILKKTVDDYQRYLGKLDKLYQLMSSDPQPLSGQEGQFFAEALIRPFNIGQEPLEEALDIVLEEVNERVTNRRGILPSGSPKLMANFVPIYLPWVVKMFEQNRVGLTYLEGFMPSKKQLQPPRFEDPFMAVAETWLKQSYTVNPGYEAEMMVEKINARGVDGFVFGFFDFDRWLGSDHKLLSKMVREKSEVPVFYIEGDLFEDRDYSPEALRTRIESICEIVKMQKS